MLNAIREWIKQWTARDALALSVTILSFIVVIILGVYVSLDKDIDASKGAGFALTVLLPLIGTWVGTILAFYFSKENFEAASKSVRESARMVTGAQQLSSTLVANSMTPLSELTIAQIDLAAEPAKHLYADILAVMDRQPTPVNRLPILDSDNKPRYIVHRSSVADFVLGLAKLPPVAPAAAPSPTTIPDPTFQDFLGFGDNRSRLAQAFGVVKLGATLADAKAEMDKVAFRQDVFVTREGTANEPVLGLITNVIIDRFSQVK